MKNLIKLIAAVTAFSITGAVVAKAADASLLNVSYDPTRELYEEYNTAFAKYWKAKTGNDVMVSQSHDIGGSFPA